MKFTEAEGDDLASFRGHLKDRIREMEAFDAAGDSASEHELGLEVAGVLLERSRAELATLLMTVTLELVLNEARVKDLEASLMSAAYPSEIPPGPVADQINHFLTHPETGVRRDLPARRGVMVGDGLTQINHFHESKGSKNV